ncbi:MAG: 6-phosphogluconolactonase [Verrucomicrobia bacterium]|nr:6-phosphogluconolactonase [Verrucomicrobiota bacterium]NBU10756.1 6-phosphogluconolactonase [Pseudomonadota bacterium]NDA67228.1 6-phosphogluconolactonase [Verrucomicrobiota bacterium]NDB76913.1 6-phosphogluconolactonase [Verrucomicrobiota bacterium]NDD38298.1 6-phosphogluconolactonase [Verrucomicrobiota bacterium]
MPRRELNRYPTAAALAAACAGEFLAFVAASSDQVTVAVSGGRIAKDFFIAVAQQAQAKGQSLSQAHFFWADERCVSPGDAESNYRSAAELLFNPMAVPASNIHRIHGDLEPDQAAHDAEAELCQFARLYLGNQPVLDLVLLGMGEDGHVASLFPGETEAVMNSPAVYRAVMASKPPPRRITLGYATIAAAREVWVLASGIGKEAALRESLAPQGKTPLARALRERARTRIFTELAV